MYTANIYIICFEGVKNLEITFNKFKEFFDKLKTALSNFGVWDNILPFITQDYEFINHFESNTTLSKEIIRDLGWTQIEITYKITKL